MDVLVTEYDRSKTIYFWNKKKIAVPLIPKNYATSGIKTVEHLSPAHVLDVASEKVEGILWDQVPVESKDLILPMAFPSKHSLMDHLIRGYAVLKPGGQLPIRFSHINFVKKIVAAAKASGNPWNIHVKRCVFPFSLDGKEFPKNEFVCVLSKMNPSLLKNKGRLKRQRVTPPSTP